MSNKWAQLIILVLADGTLRFGDLKEQVEAVSGKVLSETLRSLQRDGIIDRQAYDEMPPRVEYALTALGQTVLEPINALRNWSETHIEQVLENRDLYDDAADPSGDRVQTLPRASSRR